MSNQMSKSRGAVYALSDDEIAIVEFCRALRLSRDEALTRIATPLSSPILPQGQELQANMAAVAEELLRPVPAAEPPTTS